MLSDEVLQSLYVWVDSIPLSRPKRNIARDFSDGVLVAEIVHHYHPRLVELHNYSAANGVSQKTYNWQTLSEKVFPKIGYRINNHDVQEVVLCKPDAIEKVLYSLRDCISKYTAKKMSSSNSSIGSRMGNPNSPHMQRISERSPSRSQKPTVRVTQNRIATNNNGESSTNSSPHRDNRLRQSMRSQIQEQKKQQSDMDYEGNYKEILQEKDETIRDLKETVEILELKVQKLEQLVRLKDSKISALVEKFKG